jgi:hypothetical protein
LAFSRFFCGFSDICHADYGLDYAHNRKGWQ